MNYVGDVVTRKFPYDRELLVKRLDDCLTLSSAQHPFNQTVVLE
jgi:hypothetical protein